MVELGAELEQEKNPGSILHQLDILAGKIFYRDKKPVSEKIKRPSIDLKKLFSREKKEVETTNTPIEEKIKFKFSGTNTLSLFRHAFGILAVVFVSYFAVATLALRYEWGSFSQLAHETLVDSTRLPFLALSFLLFYLLTLVAENFHNRVALRTSLLYMFGGLVVLISGINFLY